ncbi:DUF4345 domain-containing protein [Paracnuella aquatica]|uniref:DUF4345 domain-containing protein n=1 Tax=Paracnuella aquatica TaxID=2268757 RepID=UPI000DEEA7FF|nr:DUF4345 domain-containing protein [Paracnuella aquatica]RPD48106.1 DUF4345 domain-containing protein [Paracnuella aquatica]
MKKSSLIPMLSKGFILLSACSLLSVSLMAFANPQSVMDMVEVSLENNDAASSIRGVYGGVGLTLVLALLYTIRKNVQEGLALLSLLWGLYAVSRIITIFNEGSLGAFGTKWLTIESLFFAIALTLFLLGKRSYAKQTPALR